MTRERMDELKAQTEDGCMFSPADMKEALAGIQKLREAMRDSMMDKNANPDAMSSLGHALGYEQNGWGDWVFEENRNQPA